VVGVLAAGGGALAAAVWAWHRSGAAPPAPTAGAPAGGQAGGPAAPGARTLELTPPRATRYLTLRVAARKATLHPGTPESRADVEVLVKNEGPELVLLGSAAQLRLA
jgi:hypothetical protein